MKKTVSTVFMAGFLLCSAAVYAADIDSGKQKSQACLGCHGIPSLFNVYPTYHVPLLMGQHAVYLKDALHAYRSGNRAHPTMRAQAMTLSDQDIEDIAAYFGSLETPKASGAMQKPPADIETHVNTCSACHGADGNSVAPNFPRLAGQWSDYIHQALKEYKSGKRKNPIMSSLVASLDEVDMKALAKWYASQKGLGTLAIGDFKQ